MEHAALVSLGARSVRLSVSAASDVGQVRAINEDSFLAGPAVFVVADGMGGHAHGDRASAEAIRAIGTPDLQRGWTSAPAVLESITRANMAVRALSPEGLDGEEIAGTTLTGIALLGEEPDGSSNWMVFNVGDSRTYQWQGGELNQITVDHSAVQDLLDAGMISSEEAETHPERNVVTRAMGVDADPDADVWLIPAGGKQLFLLCSDGLTKELSGECIARVISDCADPFSSTELAATLVSEAVAAGGHDNVTVVTIGAVWALPDGNGASPIPAFLEETAPRR
jgi:serine/threonine protein phosphatase PrpC